MPRGKRDLNAEKGNDLKYDYILAFDNGVTGALAICDLVMNTVSFNLSKDYIKKELSYTKAEKHITRIDCKKLDTLIRNTVVKGSRAVAVIERPMVNPRRFGASCSALRSLEATLIVLESLGIPVRYCDSKEWQHFLFGKLIAGDTKEKSRQLGLQLYPQFMEEIQRQDADALLILHWYRQKIVRV